MRGLQGLKGAKEEPEAEAETEEGEGDDGAILRRFYQRTEAGRQAARDWEAQGWTEEEWQAKVRAWPCTVPRCQRLHGPV
jgi:DNA-binding PadR family transcriptional regulator